jgi:hypothetical protein
LCDEWTELGLKYLYDNQEEYHPITCFESTTEGVHVFKAIWEYVSSFSYDG